jgi:hypothetical protein
MTTKLTMHKNTPALLVILITRQIRRYNVGSTVVEYFEWDLPKVLSQGGAELLKYADNRRFSSEPDLVKSNRDADS